MAFVKAVFRIMVGGLFGLGSMIALTPAFAAFNSYQNSIVPMVMTAVVVLCAALCFFAPSMRRAFGRGFLVLGTSVFALPVSAFFLSSRAASEVMDAAHQGTEVATAVGAGLAGVAVTGLATFFGLIVGAILLLIGLILSLGGRREVIVVDGRSRNKPATEG